MGCHGEDAPGMMEGTAEVPHQIADAHLPEAAAVFDAATALDTATDMVDPQPRLVELLVRHVLLPRGEHADTGELCRRRHLLHLHLNVHVRVPTLEHDA